MSRRSEKQKLYCQMANKELKSNLNLFGKLKSNSLAIKYPLETTTVGKIVCSSDASVVMLFVPLVFKRSVFVLSLYPPTCFSSEKASYLESHCYFFCFWTWSLPARSNIVWQKLLHYLVCQGRESLSCKTLSWQEFPTSFGLSHTSACSHYSL